MINTVRGLLTALYAKGKRKDLVVVNSTISTSDAAQIMHEEHINLLIVKQGGRYVGIVTTTDTSGDIGSSLRPSERMVSDIMTPAKDVITVSPENNLMDLPIKLSLHNIRHLVVAQDGQWIAVLDTNEVLSAVIANINEEEELRAHLNSEFRRVD